MQSQTKRTIAPAAALIGLATAAIATAAACGTTNVTNVTTTCGPGTRLIAGTCVVDAVTDAGAGTDATVVEPSGDGGADADTEPTLVDDPCPIEDLRDGGTRVYNCDPTCGAIHEACNLLRCRKTGEPSRVFATFFDNTTLRIGSLSDKDYAKIVVRLPRNPWEQFGECDSTAVPPRSVLDTSQPLYIAMTPTPHWTFAISFYMTTEERYQQPHPVFPREYLLRVYSTHSNEPSCIDGSPYTCARYEPLSTNPDRASLAPDSNSCVSVVPSQFATRFPGLGLAVLYTHATVIPARNITITQGPAASCANAP
jgi:hypothetical protein